MYPSNAIFIKVIGWVVLQKVSVEFVQYLVIETEEFVSSKRLTTDHGKLNNIIQDY